MVSLNQKPKHPSCAKTAAKRPTNIPATADSKPLKLPINKKIFDFPFFKPHASPSTDDPDTWGHAPEEINTGETFQILHQNPNGIKPSIIDPEFPFSLHMCHELGVGALCLVETNIDWHQTQHISSTKRCLHRTWSNS
jgi:hypothetical protein